MSESYSGRLNRSEGRQCRIVQGIVGIVSLRLFYSYNIMFLSEYLYILTNIYVKSDL